VRGIGRFLQHEMARLRQAQEKQVAERARRDLGFVGGRHQCRGSAQRIVVEAPAREDQHACGSAGRAQAVEIRSRIAVAHDEAAVDVGIEERRARQAGCLHVGAHAQLGRIGQRRIDEGDAAHRSRAHHRRRFECDRAAIGFAEQHYVATAKFGADEIDDMPGKALDAGRHGWARAVHAGHIDE